MRVWTDEEVASYKTHTENQLREIIKDRDAEIERLRGMVARHTTRIAEIRESHMAGGKVA